MGFSKRYLLIAGLIASANSFAVPIDWNGSLEVNSEVIRDYRRTSDDCTVVASNGSECIKTGDNAARLQDMTLKLRPSMIINDGVTIKGELSSGNADSPNTALQGEFTKPQSSYFSQSTSSSLNVSQVYAEIYADTALYRIGRFAKSFGLGAVVNSGSKSGDKFYSGYEGFEAQLKIGNFHLTPMWAKLHTNRDTNGNYSHAYETSVSVMYDNDVKDLKVGVYYAVRESSSSDSNYGSQNVSLIDVFVEKGWEKFRFALEVPMISGELGSNLYGTSDANFDANAYILETEYNLNSKWDVGVNAGMVKGDDGESDSFEAMYLHPNYKIAEVMFKYNHHGFSDSSYNVYNSSIVNATFAKFYANYTSGEWTWKIAAIWAKANEIANKGDKFYNHGKRELANTTAVSDQSDDLGYELDLAFDYKWNPSVTFSGFVGYHFVGEFYGFDNASEDLDVTNVMNTGMKLSVAF